MALPNLEAPLGELRRGELPTEDFDRALPLLARAVRLPEQADVRNRSRLVDLPAQVM